MHPIKNTRSKTYIVPIISKFIEIHKGLFLNSFLFDVNFPDINIDKIEGLFLLFRWSDNPVHKVYEEALINSPHVNKHYDIDQSHYMIYFKFPQEMEYDVNCILKGHYSKISNEAKRSILNYFQAAENSKIYYILTKSKKYKEILENELNVTISNESELGDKLNYHEEIFNQIIKKIVLK